MRHILILKTLVCFVYDPEGRIGNSIAIENDLNTDEPDKLNVCVYVFRNNKTRG
ncbi:MULTISPECIES: hypothetical protein [unclassified Shouchella]|uniref:PD-(D/E)XK nuclease domain-containing protein n=1 Tax=unclassified Shouchella TaxID=2893065 RepID=UPI0039A17A1C